MKTRHVTPESLYLTRFILHEGGKRFRRDMSRAHLLYLDAGGVELDVGGVGVHAQQAVGLQGGCSACAPVALGAAALSPRGLAAPSMVSLRGAACARLRHVVGPGAARHVLTTCSLRPLRCRERGTTYPSVDEASTQERENTRTPSTGQPASPPKRILHHCKQFLTVGESAWHWPLRTKS